MNPPIITLEPLSTPTRVETLSRTLVGATAGGGAGVILGSGVALASGVGLGCGVGVGMGVGVGPDGGIPANHEVRKKIA
jgi:hypothetical protein